MSNFNKLLKIRNLLKKEDQKNIDNLLKQYNNTAKDIKGLGFSSDIYVQQKLKSEIQQIELQISQYTRDIFKYINTSQPQEKLAKEIAQNIEIIKEFSPSIHHDIIDNIVKETSDRSIDLGPSSDYFPQEYIKKLKVEQSHSAEQAWKQLDSISNINEVKEEIIAEQKEAQVREEIIAVFYEDTSSPVISSVLNLAPISASKSNSSPISSLKSNSAPISSKNSKTPKSSRRSNSLSMSAPKPKLAPISEHDIKRYEPPNQKAEEDRLAKEAAEKTRLEEAAIQKAKEEADRLAAIQKAEEEAKKEDARKAKEAEEARIAAEEEAKKAAKEAEDARKAKEAEDARKAKEAEEDRLAKEAEDARKAKEAEDARKAKEAEEARIAAEKKRLEEEAKEAEKIKKAAEEDRLAKEAAEKKRLEEEEAKKEADRLEAEKNEKIRKKVDILKEHQKEVMKKLCIDETYIKDNLLEIEIGGTNGAKLKIKDLLKISEIMKDIYAKISDIITNIDKTEIYNKTQSNKIEMLEDIEKSLASKLPENEIKKLINSLFKLPIYDYNNFSQDEKSQNKINELIQPLSKLPEDVKVKIENLHSNVMDKVFFSYVISTILTEFKQFHNLNNKLTTYDDLLTYINLYKDNLNSFLQNSKDIELPLPGMFEDDTQDLEIKKSIKELNQLNEKIMNAINEYEELNENLENLENIKGFKDDIDAFFKRKNAELNNIDDNLLNNLFENKENEFLIKVEKNKFIFKNDIISIHNTYETYNNNIKHIYNTNLELIEDIYGEQVDNAKITKFQACIKDILTKTYEFTQNITNLNNNNNYKNYLILMNDILKKNDNYKQMLTNIKNKINDIKETSDIIIKCINTNYFNDVKNQLVEDTYIKTQKILMLYDIININTDYAYLFIFNNCKINNNLMLKDKDGNISDVKNKDKYSKFENSKLNQVLKYIDYHIKTHSSYKNEELRQEHLDELKKLMAKVCETMLVNLDSDRGRVKSRAKYMAKERAKKSGGILNSISNFVTNGGFMYTIPKSHEYHIIFSFVIVILLLIVIMHQLIRRVLIASRPFELPFNRRPYVDPPYIM
jgi:hypothetical protein